MRIQGILALAVSTLGFVACASEPEAGPEAGRALLEDVAASMGGWDVLAAISEQELISEGSDWDPLQGLAPGEERQMNSFVQTMLINHSGPSMRLEVEGEAKYPFPGSPIRFTEVIDGDVGAVFKPGADGNLTAARMQGSRLAARIRDIHRLPRQLVFVARDASDLTRAEDRVVDGQPFHVLQFTDGGHNLEVLVDPVNRLPSRVIYLETDPFVGDVTNELVYRDWRESEVSAAGAGESMSARLPFGQVVHVNGERLREEAYRSIVNNGRLQADVFDIPQAVRDAAEPGERILSQWTLTWVSMGFDDLIYGNAPQDVVLTDLAPGVVHVTGGAHHSMAVEMADHLVVVEAPLHEERSIAVLDALEKRFPGKPVRYVVVTHFHRDHAGGVRAYAARGATVIAEDSVADFLSEAFARPNTVRPDLLSRAGVTPTVEAVGEGGRELSDGGRLVRLVHVPNEHVARMLLVYLPAERLVFVSDLYAPGRPPRPDDAHARAFYDAVIDAGLDVETVVGGHGSVGPFRTLAAVMERPGLTALQNR